MVVCIDSPEKILFKTQICLKLRYWAAFPTRLAVMKAENSFTGGQKREGIMFEEFNASAKCFPSVVNLYLKEHFCLISTVIC